LAVISVIFMAVKARDRWSRRRRREGKRSRLGGRRLML